MIVVENYAPSFSTELETGLIIIIIIIIGPHRRSSSQALSVHPISRPPCLACLEAQASVVPVVPLSALLLYGLRQAPLCARSHFAHRGLNAASGSPAQPRPRAPAAPPSGGVLGLVTLRSYPTRARPSRSSSRCI